MRRGFGVLLLLMLMSAAAAAKAGNGAVTPRPTGPPYLDAIVDNRSPYVGQEVTVTYSLYFSGTAPRIVDSGKAEHPGLWVQEVAPEGYIRSSVVKDGGRNLRMAVVKQLKMVPMQAGRLSVSNYRLKCFLPSGTGADSSPDVESVITAPTATIVARPLPKGAPEGYGGAVGDFSIGLAAARYQVHAGAPLTLAVKISGRGNLQAFPQVALELPKEFRQVDSGMPTVTGEGAGKAADALYSNIAITSDQPGSFRFTPVRLAAFNPWKGRYETVSSGEITVTVLPKENAAKPAVPEPLPAATVADGAGWLPPAIMILMATAFLALIAMLFLKSKKHRKRPAPPSQEKRPGPPPSPRTPSTPETPEVLKQRIYDALAKAGIKKPAGLTSAQLRQELEDGKIGPECMEALIEVMNMIDRAVYTPGKIPAETLEKLNRKAASALGLLERQRSL
ncbi:MAG: protein BatD [Chlorobiaceae bacterium]|nr:protein BatD [Chlorobiaceae bacterium]